MKPSILRTPLLVCLASVIVTQVMGIPSPTKSAGDVSHRILSENFDRMPLSLRQVSYDTPKLPNFWEGTNPFKQPSPNTRYYGSGDINLDCVVDGLDLVQVQGIVSGTRAICMQADVNGDRQVDQIDVQIISELLGGVRGYLPGWWDQLQTKEERNHWIDQVLKIDDTNQWQYNQNWVCENYSHNFVWRSTGVAYSSVVNQGSIVYEDRHYKGSAIYNIPVYDVTVYEAVHAINAILVGDNPLEFNDWRFIEPQEDSNVSIGGWNMPNNGDVEIMHVAERWHSSPVINFAISDGQPSLLNYDPNLVINRENTSSTKLTSSSQGYNATLVKESHGHVLQMASRDTDLSIKTDIFLSTMGDISPKIPIFNKDRNVRFLAATTSPEGYLHVVWANQIDENDFGFVSALHTSLINSSTGEIVATYDLPVQSHYAVSNAAIVYDAQNTAHIVWGESSWNALSDRTNGIYASHWDSVSQTWGQVEQIYYYNGDYQDNSDVVSYLGIQDAVLYQDGFMIAYALQTKSQSTYDSYGNETSWTPECSHVMIRPWVNGKWGEQKTVASAPKDPTWGHSLSTISQISLNKLTEGSFIVAYNTMSNRVDSYHGFVKPYGGVFYTISNDAGITWSPAQRLRPDEQERIDDITISFDLATDKNGNAHIAMVTNRNFYREESDPNFYMPYSLSMYNCPDRFFSLNAFSMLSGENGFRHTSILQESENIIDDIRLEKLADGYVRGIWAEHTTVDVKNSVHTFDPSQIKANSE